MLARMPPAGQMSQQPLVSVVLPTRDRARWIARAVESVLAQTYERLELLVVDDGSSDGTQEVLRRFGSQVTLLSRPGTGVYAARNFAVAHASGELVAFIDSDDAWLPNRLASQVPLLARPEVGLVFGDAIHVVPGASSTSRPRTSFEVTPPRRGRVADHFAWGNFVPTGTVLVRRSCLQEACGFPESHAVSADYLTWFRIAVHHELDFVPAPVADYTVHDGGISSDLGHSLQARIELFSAELERARDPAVRAMLERLIFNLGLHLALAVPRGRADSVDHVWSVVRSALGAPPAPDAVVLGAAFVARHAQVRARRRFGAPAS
jgi:glycosyltransferase involved in cell wall biosynthesis